MADTEELRVTPRMIEILKVMLENPRGAYYGLGLSEVTGIATGTIQPLLMRLERAGWLKAEWGKRAVGRAPRRLFKFTPGTIKLARKVVK